MVARQQVGGILPATVHAGKRVPQEELPVREGRGAGTMISAVPPDRDDGAHRDPGPVAGESIVPAPERELRLPD